MARWLPAGGPDGHRDGQLAARTVVLADSGGPSGFWQLTQSPVRARSLQWSFSVQRSQRIQFFRGVPAPTHSQRPPRRIPAGHHAQRGEPFGGEGRPTAQQPLGGTLTLPQPRRCLSRAGGASFDPPSSVYRALGRAAHAPSRPRGGRAMAPGVFR
eukprot:gene12165-biopygen11995